eukprot:CAMPEP_0203760132 /NCGR_PEP_ID=MMETSP0098-20131031/13499_1 /ASSEMBLY_ACC=CAM_ASM_000208 /TAXON_ID=96639 /ORGANISM=" , Strain NY0313808BC1" /LENGTH=633 /DNA_ID=CAMNT_0050653589 /DNA_START=139 /DNA_END=2040 /DNA_ORIENTATION=+
MDAYNKLYAESIDDPAKFWGEQAKKLLRWEREFEQSMTGSFVDGDVAFFTGGKINACVNCIDRHIDNGKGDDVAIIWEGDEPGTVKKFTFKECLREISRIANVLIKYGVKKGDPVTIYMPMIPMTAFVMLACVRIGAPHSIVFAGFSSEALRDRIDNVHSKYVFTTDEGLRGGRKIPLKNMVDAAVNDCEFLENIFMFKRTGVDVNFVEGRDVWMEPEMEGQRPYCPATPMDAEDTLFYLYTSGSTGQPKGLAHTTAGYLLYTSMTHRYVFDYRPGDVYACVADCGWITGHSYIVYGPLLNGATTLMFESTPLYPDAGRYWDMVERHKITQFYTAPTAIRALMRFGVEPLKKYDLSTLRVLGSVGEPINPEAWKWYYENVGGNRCSIVDTYWQTETGGIIVTPLPGCTTMKPGSATLPFFGIELEILNPQTGEVQPQVMGEEQDGVLCVKKPWPSVARTVFNNHERYMNTYLRPYPGYYFTGDGCTRDVDGYYWITGRVDDVMNVSGHRIGSAEIESALVASDAVAEAAVVGYPHEVKGEAIACYVITRNGVQETPELIKDLVTQIRQVIGAFASPSMMVCVSGLPKTRSGKIMRRVLRKIASNEADQLGDTSTLADPAIVDELIAKVASLRK